jgi:hypothetical protein
MLGRKIATSALALLTAMAAMLSTPASNTTAEADCTACVTVNIGGGQLSGPKQFVDYSVVLLTGSCALGVTGCAWKWDWQAHCLMSSPYCYLHGTGTLKLTAEDCTAASLTGTMSYDDGGPILESFNVSGATFGSLYALDGSGGQFMTGEIDLTSLCSGLSQVTAGGYGWGYVF